MAVVISGVGLWHPEDVITNDELVASYNAWAERFNAEHADAITAGDLAEKPLSSSAFIEKASGIKQRYVYRKEGVLDIDVMRPVIDRRSDDELSHTAEMGVQAAERALAAANKQPADIDMVIVSCAYTERAYPALAIEIQHKLGIVGTGFDMLVACSAATFAMQRAHDAVAAGSARAVLVVNPELATPQINWTDRDSHFIFGDVATATVIEDAASASSDQVWEILASRSQTSFSNNIRSNFGHLARSQGGDPFDPDRLFHQNGRSVFKEVCPMAAEHLARQVEDGGLAISDIRRWWLHQANINMNQLITRKLVGKDSDPDLAPIVLDRFANTASAGSIIAFAEHQADLKAGDHGVICSFGAGYSIGSLLLRKR